MAARRARTRWWVALVALALVSLPAITGAQVRPELGQALKDSDRNRDGRLDREEFYRVMVEAFFFRDRNKDGYLVIVEVSELSPERFRAADRDGDGRLSLDEYVHALFKDFAAADADGNGVLTYEEIQRYVERSGR